MMEMEWVCSICNFHGTLTSIEKLQHINVCKKGSSSDVGIKSSIIPPKKKNAVAYECANCQKTLYLTPTEVLRHRRQHEK